jgi:hypothetical protein
MIMVYHLPRLLLEHFGLKLPESSTLYFALPLLFDIIRFEVIIIILHHSPFPQWRSKLSH